MLLGCSTITTAIRACRRKAAPINGLNVIADYDPA
jgi:hypothetical protein